MSYIFIYHDLLVHICLYGVIVILKLSLRKRMEQKNKMLGTKFALSYSCRGMTVGSFHVKYQKTLVLISAFQKFVILQHKENLCSDKFFQCFIVERCFAVGKQLTKFMLHKCLIHSSIKYIYNEKITRWLCCNKILFIYMIYMIFSKQCFVQF